MHENRIKAIGKQPNVITLKCDEVNTCVFELNKFFIECLLDLEC